jgi:hypothetical protein
MKESNFHEVSSEEVHHKMAPPKKTLIFKRCNLMVPWKRGYNLEKIYRR